MKVKKLIKKLQKLDPDMKVLIPDYGDMEDIESVYVKPVYEHPNRAGYLNWEPWAGDQEVIAVVIIQ